MRILVFVASFLAVLGMAYWAYQQNFETKQAQDRVKVLQLEIAAAREAIAIQRAEWAYLNRPERLRDLVDLNFEDLELFPMTPEHFGTIDEVPFPNPGFAEVEGLIDGITDAQSTVGRPPVLAPDVNGASFP